MKIKTIALSALVATVIATVLTLSFQSSARNNNRTSLDDPPPATFIPIDSANKMIKSYLSSVGAGSVDTNLYSISFNADSLRLMLNSEANGQISRVKIMFAHTLGYINSGHQNQYCGYKTGALTLVIAGYDNEGNNVYYPAGRVMDIGAPCPPLCREAGDTLVSVVQ